MSKGSFILKGHEKVAEKRDVNIYMPRMLQVAAQSWTFGMAGIFYLIYFQSAIILLNYLAGAEAAAVYSVAFSVMAAVYLLPSVIYQKFLLNKLHRWAYQDREQFYKVYRFGNLTMLILGLCAMLSIWLIAPWGIPLLFGKKFQEAVALLMVYALSIPVRFLATSIGATLVTRENMSKKVGYMGGVAALNLILNFLLIPKFATLGAVIAAVLCDLVLLVIYICAVKKHVFTDDYAKSVV